MTWVSSQEDDYDDYSSDFEEYEEIPDYENVEDIPDITAPGVSLCLRWIKKFFGAAF